MNRVADRGMEPARAPGAVLYGSNPWCGPPAVYRRSVTSSLAVRKIKAHISMTTDGGKKSCSINA